jgi:hypothetical protein
VSGMTSQHNITAAPATELLPDGVMRWRREQDGWVGAVEGIDLILVAGDHRGLFRWSIWPVDDRLTGSGSASGLAEAKRTSHIAVVYARATQRAEEATR